MARAIRYTLLGALLLGAVLLRGRDLGRRGFWLDENYSAEISAGHGFGHLDVPHDRLLDPRPDLQGLDAAGPWWSTWTSQGRDNSPPFYFSALRLWRDVAGSSDFAMRALSVICSVAAVGVIYLTGRELFGRVPALWAAALATVAVSQLEYARQARPYAMLTMLGCIALWAMARIDRQGWNWRRGVMLAVASIATLATHWLSLGFILALVAYSAFAWRGTVRRRVLLTFAVVGLIAAAALAPMEVHQIRHAAFMTSWLRDKEPGHAGRVAAIVYELPLRFFGKPYGRSWLDAGWGLLCVLPILLIWRSRRRDLILPTLCFYGTLAVPVAVDLWKGTLASGELRYVILAGPCLFLMIAGAFAGRGRWLPHLLPAAAVLFCGVSLGAFYAEPANEDWRWFAEPVKAAPREPIIFACTQHTDPEALPGVLYLCASRYLPADHAAYLTDRPLTESEMREIAKAAQGNAWLLVGWSKDAMPNNLLPGCGVTELKWRYPLGYVAHVQMTAR